MAHLGSPIAEGNTATIYLHNRKIIKLFKDYLPPSEAKEEAVKQRFAKQSGLPVPKIMEVTKINENQAIIMEYVKGRTLGSLIKENLNQLKKYLTLSVDVQLKIHRISVYQNDFEKMEQKLYKKISAASQLSKDQEGFLKKLLSERSFDNKLCHGDYHFYNLIQTDKDIKIIDWVDASSGSSQADVCRTYLLYLSLSAEIAELYLRLYCEKSNLTNEEILSWMPILSGARLAENVSIEEERRLLQLIDEAYNKK